MLILAVAAFVAVGGWAWQEWSSPRTQVTVQACHAVVAMRGRWYPQGKHIVDVCRVSWRASDGSHTATVQLPSGQQAGDEVALVMHDDVPQPPASPAPLIYLAAVGLIAGAAGLWMLQSPGRDTHHVGGSTRT